MPPQTVSKGTIKRKNKNKSKQNASASSGLDARASSMLDSSICLSLVASPPKPAAPLSGFSASGSGPLEGSANSITSMELPERYKENSTGPLKSQPKGQRPIAPSEVIADGKVIPRDLVECEHNDKVEQMYDKDKTLQDLPSLGMLRVGAGGSLRMPKKRAQRPLVKDIQWESGFQIDVSSPHSVPLRDSTNRTGESSTQVSSGDKQAPIGSSRQSSTSSSKTSLNPLAAAFTSPTKTGADISRGSDKSTGVAYKSFPEPDRESLKSVNKGSSSSSTMDHEDELKGAAMALIALENIEGGHKDAIAEAGTVQTQEGEPSGTVSKSQKKKKSKKGKNKGQIVAATYDDMWPSLPKGPQDRASTNNTPPAAWPSQPTSMPRDSVNRAISPAKVFSDEHKGSGQGWWTPEASIGGEKLDGQDGS